MKIYRQNSKDKVANCMFALQKHFRSTDTWGVIETSTIPDQAESDFMSAILSDDAAREQEALENFAKEFPEKYKNIVPSEYGKTVFSVFHTEYGSKIMFITTYAQKTVKKIFTVKTMGAGMKIHAGKVRNRFEPTGWRRESWFFVARALSTGNEYEFPLVSRYN